MSRVPTGTGVLLDAGDQGGQPLRQGNAASFDADHGEFFRAVVAFDHLMRQPHQRALDLRGGHDPRLFLQTQGLLLRRVVHKGMV